VGEAIAVRMLDEARSLDDAPSAAEVLKKASAVDLRAWFERQEAEMGEALSELQGAWPTEPPPPQDITSHTDILSGKPLSVVAMALVGTTDPTTLPAIFRFGDWNACPAPEVHVALLRRWRQHYDIEPVSLTGDVLEFRVARPPTVREAAVALAREQYLYCSDIVDQGVGSVLALASMLQDGKYWYFWWD
jgi:hypothetical protein